MIGTPVVGRSLELPGQELFYFLERSLDGYVELHGPGYHWRRKFTGRAEDFRDYGEALMERVNPALEALPVEERSPVRERLVAAAHRAWDAAGARER